MARVHVAVALLALSVESAVGQDRDAKVKNDRALIENLGGWIYNDLDAGIARARADGKPLLIVFRCIPCEACHQFDDDVARRDAAVRELMDQFVCVRIVQCNALDLTLFQHDFDQSFAITLMHPDGSILGRFGTRSSRDDESRDISLQGLRECLEAALKLHRDFHKNRSSLAGKRVNRARFATPLDYPSLKGKYQPTLEETEGQVARSCVHCHQIGDAERDLLRGTGQPISGQALFPYPNPSVLGLIMDPKHKASVLEVAPGSTSESDGLKAGDVVETMVDQPICSVADMQWVLHHAPDRGSISISIVRDAKPVELTLTLDQGWRQRSDLSWRATTWNLRRMGLGGMLLEPLTITERKRLGILDGRTGLRVKHVGEYGNHAVAKNAGVRSGDVLLAYDGRDDFDSETSVLAYSLQQKRPGDEVSLTVLRDGEKRQFRITLQ